MALPAEWIQLDSRPPQFSGASLGAQPGQPTHTLGQRKVRVRVAIKHVMNVSLVDQWFKARVQLEASWTDEKCSALVDESKEYWPKRVPGENPQRKDLSYRVPTIIEGGREVEEKERVLNVFDPRLSFTNMIESEEDERWVSLYHDTTPGTQQAIVCYRWAFVGTFQEPLELNMFPMDHQDLPMMLTSGWPLNDVKLIKQQNTQYSSYVTVTNFVQKQSYILYDRLKFDPLDTSADESATKQVYPLLRVSMHVERLPKFWLQNIVSPMFLIASAALSTYSVATDDFGDQMNVNVGVLIAIIGYKYMIAEKLPNLSYATLVDKYVLMCFFFVQLVILDHTLVVNEILPHHGIFWPIIFWLAVHMLFVYGMCVMLMNEQRGKQFWIWEENAIWVGLGHKGDAMPSKESLLKELRAVTKVDASDVVLWTADSAREKLDEEMTSYKGAGVKDAMENVANKYKMRGLKEKEHEVLVQYEAEEYTGNQNFAVVVYDTAKAAEKAVLAFDAEKEKGGAGLLKSLGRSGKEQPMQIAPDVAHHSSFSAAPAPEGMDEQDRGSTKNTAEKAAQPILHAHSVFQPLNPRWRSLTTTSVTTRPAKAGRSPAGQPKAAASRPEPSSAESSGKKAIVEMAARGEDTGKITQKSAAEPLMANGR